MKSQITLHLSKQKFKFSSGHFLIFDKTRAEKLHGHNYSVKVKLKSSANQDLGTSGYLVDFSEIKKIIQESLDLWDEHVLLPAQHPDMKFSQKGKNLEVHFRDRFYSFPQNEVHLLPTVNTSVEELSRLLAEDFFKKMKKWTITEVWVLVEETPGQGASFLARG
ncbi:MAG: 6-pyruvoyl trahydropterin synthase family protein [Bdellovibrionales bacterium]